MDGRYYDVSSVDRRLLGEIQTCPVQNNIHCIYRRRLVDVDFAAWAFDVDLCVISFTAWAFTIRIWVNAKTELNFGLKSG